MLSLTILCTFLALVSQTLAGFDSKSKTNIVVYWGQNSGGVGQESLASYCDDEDIDVILLAFMTSVSDDSGNFKPVLNFANHGCQQSGNSYSCPELETDIKACQEKKKTILLSLGGDVRYSSEEGFDDDQKAKKAAQDMWKMFGPTNDTNAASDRPFGKAVIDGFDFDFEENLPRMGVFGEALHEAMGGKNKGKYLIVGAPNCELPLKMTMFGEIPFDAIIPQQYNNPQCNRNFAAWNDWTKEKQIPFIIGLPGASGAAGNGYVEPNKLSEIFEKAKGLERLGGAMLWDVAQAVKNDNYHKKVKEALSNIQRRSLSRFHI